MTDLARLVELVRDSGIAVDEGREACAEAESDFGGLIRGRALGVVSPRDIEELLALVRCANRHGIALTPRGTGHGQSGQSVALDSLSVSLRGLSEIAPVQLHDESIWCGAGATWRELLAVSAAFGLCPPVLPLNLDLSIGGVLSAGGFGSTSHRAGAALDHVLTLEVITGGGERVTCSREDNRELFEAVLGGLGRFGLIARARLALRPRAARVRTFFLHYTDAARLFADQRVLADTGRAHHLEGFCSATVQGLRKGSEGTRTPFALWSYALHVSVEYADTAPEQGAVLAGLTCDRVVHVEDDEADAFAARYDVRFEVMRAQGQWQQLHPWLDCLLPVGVAEQLLPQLLEHIPLLLGDGHRLTWVRPSSPAGSMVWPAQQPMVGLSVLPLGVAAPLRERVLSALAAVERVLLEHGGKRYLSGWLFGRDEAAWRRHFGAQYESWRRQKARFDPNNVLCSQLFPG